MGSNAASSCFAQGKHFLTAPVFFGLFIGVLIGHFVLPLLRTSENRANCAALYVKSDGRPGLVEAKIHEHHRKNSTRRAAEAAFDESRSNFVHITTKTTASNLDTRLPTLRKTWFSYASMLANILKVCAQPALVAVAVENHLVIVNSRCAKTHATMDLCCKTQAEFKTYYLREDNPTWFCRFDDDNYVNLENLIALLRKYNSETGNIYLGQRSLLHPVGGTYTAPNGKKTGVSFEFLNGGSGLCFSKSLMERLKPTMFGDDGTGTGFKGMCKNMGHADDVLLGYFVTNALRVNWTESDLFTCWQTQDLESLSPDDLLQAVTLTYRNKESTTNLEATVNIPGFPGILNTAQDPTRFLSLHKYLQHNGFYGGLPNGKTT